MKKLLALLAFAASPLFAQYGPPAKDLEDAQFYMREILRQLEPAMTETREQAVVFALVARAHNMLIGKEPAEEIARAMKSLDDFMERRERGGKELSRENLKTILSIRKELELAQPPYDILALRERLHHEFVHPLELQALANLAKVENLEGQWQMFVSRWLEPIKKDTMNGVRATALDLRPE
jgi:hypothetical protein